MKKISLLLTLALLVSMFTGVVFAATPTDGDGQYTRVIFDGSTQVPTYSQNSYFVYEGGRVTAVTDATYTSTYADNTITVTRKADLSSNVVKRQLVMQSLTPITSGVAVFGFDFSANYDMTNFRTDGLYDKNNALLQGTKDIVTGGKVYASVDFEANKVYKIEIAVDLDNNLTSHYLDGELMTTQSLSANVTEFSMLKFDWRGHNAVGDYINLANPYVKWVKAFPKNTGIAYINENNEKVPATNTISYKAKSVVVDFDDKIDDGYTVTLKNGDETINTSCELADNSIVITPEYDFIPNASYTLCVSNLTACRKAFDDVNISFGADYIFDIVSPKANQVLEDAGVVNFEAEIPSYYTDVNFLIDGYQVVATADGGKYYANVDTAELTLGNHTFTVSANGGANVKSVDFEVTKNLLTHFNVDYSSIRTKGDKDWYPMGNGIKYSKETGYDGEAEGAVGFWNSEKSASSMAYLAFGQPTKWYIDTYIKRDPGASLKLQRDSGYTIYFGGDYLINANGQIGVSGVIMPANEWHHLKLVVDTENGTYELYYDGQKVQDQTKYNHANLTGKTNTQVRFVPGPVSADGTDYKIYTDNMRMGAYYENPRVASVAYTKGNETVVAEGNVISALSDTIILTMTKNFDAITASDITVNGVFADSVTVDADAKTITIKPMEGSIIPNGTVNIGFDSALTSGETSIDGEMVVRLASNSDVEDEIKTFTRDGQTVEVVINKASSDSVFGDSVILYIAGYDDNALVSIKPVEIKLVAGVNAVSETLTETNGATSFKAFLWDGVTPICVSK